MHACNLQNKRKLLCVLNIYCIFSNFPHSGIFQEPESAQPGSGAARQSAAGQHAVPRQQGGGAGAGVDGVQYSTVQYSTVQWCQQESSPQPPDIFIVEMILKV